MTRVRLKDMGHELAAPQWEVAGRPLQVYLTLTAHLWNAAQGMSQSLPSQLTALPDGRKGEMADKSRRKGPSFLSCKEQSCRLSCLFFWPQANASSFIFVNK